MIDGVKTTEFPLKANTPNKETQRIAIAQMGPLSYLVVTTEGPENPRLHRANPAGVRPGAL